MNSSDKPHNGNKLPISKEELIEKIGSWSSVESTEAVLSKLSEIGFLNYDGKDIDVHNENGGIRIYPPELSHNFHHISKGYHGGVEFSAREFLSWFEEEPTSTLPKKRGRKPKAKPLNKREKWEARIESFEKEKKEALSCSHDGREIGVYVNGEYSTNSTCSPEEALVFAKWIINLEGK